MELNEFNDLLESEGYKPLELEDETNSIELLSEMSQTLESVSKDALALAETKQNLSESTEFRTLVDILQAGIQILDERDMEIEQLQEGLIEFRWAKNN